MREKLRYAVRWLKISINRNAGFLIAAAIVFFGLSNIGFQKDNKQLLQDTKTAAEQSKAAAENTETIIANQQTDLQTLKAEIASLKRFSACLLALHDAGEFADGDVQAQCERMSNSVGINDVRRSSAPSNSSQDTSQPQNTNGQGANNPPDEQSPTPPEDPARPLIPTFDNCVTPLVILGFCL